MADQEIGTVAQYFSKAGVAAIELTGSIKVGDNIHIKGHTTDLTQTVSSMQIDKNVVKEASGGDAVGIKVNDRVRPGDKVYKL
ncbi:translation elongation factor-like protein [Candidatus Woesearchaeota archaeon]|nr:translation elongation factor-like protein [Candidatus Woesearchaeota archaeon]